MVRKIVTYWEGPITWLERLGINSILSQGHNVEIFTHDVDQLKSEGLGVEIFDVRDLVPDRPPISLYRERGHFSLYADIVRLALLEHERGIWSDADCIFLRKLNEDEEFIMGWVDEQVRINNAVLVIPHNSSLLEAYWQAITSLPIRVPWATHHVRIKREIGIFMGRPIPNSLRTMSIGPRALTYFVKKLNLEKHASPPHRFYPLRDTHAHLLVQKDDRAARSKIKEETEIVHAWRGKLITLDVLGAPPPASSYLGQQWRKLQL